MSDSRVPELTSREESDGTLVVEGENADCQVSIGLRPDLFADPRWRHLLPKLFAIEAPIEDKAA